MTIKVPHWPDVIIPHYAAGRYGRWTMHTTTGAMPGWYTPDVYKGTVPGLKRREHGKDIVWMSLTLMEQESHMQHIEAATGNVLVMGLGMGMYLYNIIQKPNVQHVVVIERDPQVREMLERCSDFLTWPNRDKIEFVIDDALKFQSSTEFDYVYADFWKHMGDPKMTTWMRRIYQNVPNAKLYGYWTMEWDFVNFLRDTGLVAFGVDAENYALWATDVGPPLIGVGSPIAHHYAILAVTVQYMARAIYGEDNHFLAYAYRQEASARIEQIKKALSEQMGAAA